MPEPAGSHLWSPGALATDEQSAEGRAFLQRRVRLYVGVCFSLWFFIAIMSQLAALAWMPPGGTGSLQPMLWTHAVVTLALAAAWGATRWMNLAPAPLRFLDAFATLAQGVAGGVILPFTIVAFRADLSMVMGLSFVCVARAAIVPSGTWRTALLGGSCGVPLITGTQILYTAAGAAAPLPAPVASAQVATWVFGGTVLSAVISRVIYGLRRQVQASARLGQYTLEGKIGEGGMGSVFRARHTLLRRPTAVKVLHPSGGGDVSFARFEREVQLTSEISHPNIVAVYDYGRSLDGAFYYAMEYLDGFDLQELVDTDGPQPPGRVVHILTQAAEALAEAHAVGLIHRDIKPGNIVLCEHTRRPDHVKVVDFGLVRQIGNSDPALSTADAITGTPLYLAPEAITSPNDIDERADLYALGAVGYFLLTGQPVFSGSSVLQVLARALHEPIERPSAKSGRDTPADLERVILACLARDRNQRPKDAPSLQRDLASCTGIEPWTPDDARRWWQSKPPKNTSRDPKHSSPFTATLAVAPRP